MHSPIRTWLFVLLLLVSQAVFAVHEADIDQHSGVALCDVCLIGQSLDATGLVSADYTPGVLDLVQVFQSVLAQNARFIPVLQFVLARAPPVNFP